MSLKKLLILTSMVAVAAGLVAPGAVKAIPLAQDNLLRNPGMEMPYTNGKQPDGWGRWFEDTGKPSDASGLNYAIQPNFSAETLTQALIHSGAASQHVGRQYDPWHGGLKQDLDNVPPNTPLQFCAWNRLYANNFKFTSESSSVSSMNGRGRVGIFPDGNVEWDNPGIIWSGEINPHDNWQQVCVQATSGGSGKVSVFTSNDYRGSGAIHLDAWWDDASLTAQGTPQAPQPAAPAQPQQPQPTAPPPVQSTPNAQGAIVHTIVAGDTLFGLSFQYNVPLEDIYALNGLNSQSILQIGQQVIIKAGPGAQPPAPAQPTAAPTTAPEAAQSTPAAPSAAQTPESAAPAASQSTPAPGSAETGSSKLCLSAFNDNNSDGLRQTTEGSVAGAEFDVIDAQGSTVVTYTSTSDPAPYCFTNLTAGSYTVDVQPASGTTATSDKRWGVALTSGSTVNINFGSEGGTGSADSGAQAEATPEKSSGGSSIGGLLGGAVGLILLLVAGVMGAFIIARRRA